MLHPTSESPAAKILGSQAKPWAGVDCLVTRHVASLNSTSGWSLDIPYGSRHDAGMKILFLQRRWAAYDHHPSLVVRKK